MKSIKIKTVKTRRKFDETFKREALNNWLTSNKSAEVVAQELGVTSSRLYAWKQRFAPGPAGGRRGRGQCRPRPQISNPNWMTHGARSVTSGSNVTF